MIDELVVFISHIFNEFFLARYNEIKANLLDNQKIIWAYNTDIDDDLKKNDIEGIKIFLSKNYFTGKDNDIVLPKYQFKSKYNAHNPNNDEYFLEIYDKLSNYKNYWFIENDVSMNTKDKTNSFKQLFDFYKDDKTDLICSEIYSYDDWNLQDMYPYEYMKESNISKEDLRNTLLIICRISSHLLDISKNDNRFSRLFFEFKYPTICHVCGLTSEMFDKKFLDKHPFKNTNHNSNYIINNKSITWTSEKYKDYHIGPSTPIFEYNPTTLVHPIKSDNVVVDLDDFEKYNQINHHLKIWLCGDNFNLRQNCDKLTYNKFDLSLKYKRYNINEYNKMLSEYVCWYYIWANDIKSDYICTGHYSRYPIAKYISTDNLKNNQIQYFFENECICKDKNFEYPEYAFIEDQIKGFGGPGFLISDVAEWLESQSIVDINLIRNYTCQKDMIKFANREIFACKWEIFDDMMKFIKSYLNFLMDKYDMHTIDEWKNHILNNIIPWYKSHFEEFQYNEYLMVYEPIYKFKTIFEKDGGYGKNNCWRIYSYMIEIIISIYIMTHIHYRYPKWWEATAVYKS